MCNCVEKVWAMAQRIELSLCHLLNTIKCCKQSRDKEMIQFEKAGAYMQTLENEDKFVVRV
jgi:hypothetical protein